MSPADHPTDPLIGNPGEGVGFASGHSLAARHVPHWHGFLLVSLYVGGFGAAWLVLSTALLAAGAGPVPGVVRWGALAVVLACAIRWDDAMPPRSSRILPRVDDAPDDSNRVWCVWRPWRLQRLLGEGGIADEAFEPEHFAAPLARTPTAWTYIAWLALSIAAYGVIYVFLRAMNQGPLVTLNFVAFSAAIAAGWFAVAIAMPTTVRVVPGRIDILHGWFFSTRRPVIRTLDLRRPRIVLDLRNGILFLQHPDGSQDALRVALASGRGKARIGRAILRAAVSSFQPAPLPDNVAVG